MLVKLTYYGTDRPTLINLGNVESIYQVYDKNLKRYSTKVCFRGNESYINVEEDLQEILKISQDYQMGDYQSCDWVTPTVEERLLNSYNDSRPRVNNYKPRHERNYNSWED